MNVIDFFFFSCAVGLSEENLSIVEQERRTRSLTCGRHRSRDVLRVCAIDWGPVAIDEKFPGKISLTRCFLVGRKVESFDSTENKSTFLMQQVCWREQVRCD